METEVKTFTMIKTKTGMFYRVPEDMFHPFAQNLVNHGQAEWIERHELTIGEKVGAAVNAVKQALPFKSQKPDEIDQAQRQAERNVRKDVTKKIAGPPPKLQPIQFVNTGRDEEVDFSQV